MVVEVLLYVRHIHIVRVGGWELEVMVWGYWPRCSHSESCRGMGHDRRAGNEDLAPTTNGGTYVPSIHADCWHCVPLRLERGLTTTILHILSIVDN